MMQAPKPGLLFRDLGLSPFHSSPCSFFFSYCYRIPVQTDCCLKSKLSWLMYLSRAKDQDEPGPEIRKWSFLIPCLTEDFAWVGTFFFLASCFCPSPLPYHPLHSHCALRETLLPFVSFHLLLPTAAAWIFFLEMHRFTRGDGTAWLGDRDQRQIPPPRYIASAMLLLMHLYSKRSLFSLGSNHRAGEGFPELLVLLQPRAGCGLERDQAFSARGWERGVWIAQEWCRKERPPLKSEGKYFTLLYCSGGIPLSFFFSKHQLSKQKLFPCLSPSSKPFEIH